MSILNAALDIATSGTFGAITGIIGGWLKAREQLALAELRFKEKKEMRRLDLIESKMEAQQALALADKNRLLAITEGEMAIGERETDAFVESIKNQGKRTGIKIVDGIRGLMRPAITAFLLYNTWVIYDNIDTIINGLQALPVDALVSTYSTLIYQIIFLTTMAVSWWFASRPSNFLLQHKK